MTKQRSFLKWPGGKLRVMAEITAMLPAGKRLIEPFVGSAVVFLNTNYPSYILNDKNQDLINIYECLAELGADFIKQCKRYFTPKYNDPDKYYLLRDKFNKTTDTQKRAALFLYLNRHSYNGLVRYNSSGGFNAPFGRYKKPYFPDKEMNFFYNKCKILAKVKFCCEDFSKILQKAKVGDVIYADPPYVPLSETAHFTSYQPNGFDLKAQHKLAAMVNKLAEKNISVLLSNHSTDFTKEIYSNATTIKEFEVQRFISCKVAERRKVKELLALFVEDKP
ncbi:MAG: DNA adenine methylase [Thiotrichales bacterium]|nr:MAG: DNA adenine methylase [Thiotrichales bacterium]